MVTAALQADRPAGLELARDLVPDALAADAAGRPTSWHATLVLRLEAEGALAEEDRRALLAVPVSVRHFDRGEDVVRQGDSPGACSLLVEGLLCRYRTVARGRRQILGFHVAGDLPDLDGLHMRRMDYGLAACGEARVAFMAHAHLLDVFERHPNVARAMWRQTTRDASLLREWITGLGRRSAQDRIAHLLCELGTRLRAAGAADGEVCEMSLTQAHLADALGLSSVHVNRLLQALRGRGLVGLRRGRVIVRDVGGLAAACGFNPAYLDLHAR